MLSHNQSTLQTVRTFEIDVPAGKYCTVGADDYASELKRMIARLSLTFVALITKAVKYMELLS